MLNFPYNTGSDGPAGCCGFFQPSFELANSFRTDANGLPLLDGSYNSGANQLVTDFGLNSTDPFTPDAGPVDPRLDHSVGRRGIPYLDSIVHPGYNWIRDQTYGGPYSPKKFIFYKGTAATYTDGSSWTRGYTAINHRGFSGTMGGVNELKELEPSKSASLCFSMPIVISYNARMRSADPGGMKIEPGTIRVVGPAQ